MDDCSTDNSLNILEELREDIPNLVIIKQEYNAGVSCARNKGIDAARGEYVTMLDSDDYYINIDKLKNEMDKMNSDIILAYSKIVRVDNNSHLLEQQFLNNSLYLQGHILSKTMLGVNNMTLPRDYVIKRKDIMECGGYTVGCSLYEDLELLFKLLSKGKAVCTFQEGTAYRQNTNGLSSKPEKIKIRTRWRLCWKYRKLERYNSRILLTIGLVIMRLKQEIKLILVR